MFYQPSITLLECDKYLLTTYILHVEASLLCCKHGQHGRKQNSACRHTCSLLALMNFVVYLFNLS